MSLAQRLRPILSSILNLGSFNATGSLMVAEGSSRSLSSLYASTSSTSLLARTMVTAGSGPSLQAAEAAPVEDKPAGIDLRKASWPMGEVVQHRPVPPLEPRPLLASTRRVGAVAIKCGMTQAWNEYGEAFPITVLWVDDNVITQVKTEAEDGLTALQVGCGSRRPKRMRMAELGHFRSSGIVPKARLAQFSVSKDALLPVGTPINALHFVAGQYVDVTAKTKRKGFQGVMKRWNFQGGPASHGCSLAHRARGSLGNRTGRLWKGTKMAGNMGAENKCVQGLWVWKVDAARNLIYVRGAVPGPEGCYVRVRDSIIRAWQPAKFPLMAERPVPTFLGAAPAEPVTAPWDRPDPNRLGQDMDAGDKNPLKASKASAGAAKGKVKK